MFLRVAIADTGKQLNLTLPSHWRVVELKQHLATRLNLHPNDLELFETMDAAQRWIEANDPNALAFYHGHGVDYTSMIQRKMNDNRPLRDFGFETQANPIHIIVRYSNVACRSTDWNEAIQAWLPWSCLFFTLMLFVVWLDTIIPWLSTCPSTLELLRNLPWLFFSSMCFMLLIGTYIRAIVMTQRHKTYAEIA